MENNFKYSFNEKRYHTYNYYLKSTYNCKVSKVMIDGHFTCPNRDGTKGVGGCIYCSSLGSGDTNISIKEDVITQYNENKKIMDAKWPNKLYIPYFQSFTNTYGPLSKIKDMIAPFLSIDEVCEIAIATRPDSISDGCIAYLDSISYKKPITIELGLQSSNNNTANLINRCHDFNIFKECVDKLSKTNLKICVHIINGLPYETKNDMLQTIKDIYHMDIDAVKIHMLHILKDTKLANIYKEKPFNLITRDEYINIVIEQLRLLKPEVIIERLTGDPIKEDLIEPSWVLNKTTILNDIDKRMRKYNYYQGDNYK